MKLCTHFPVDPTTILRRLNETPPFINVTLNEFCQIDQKYTVLVSFGVFDNDRVCQVEYNESMDIVPGETVTFTFPMDNEMISKELGEDYCANVIVNGTAGLIAST